MPRRRSPGLISSSSPTRSAFAASGSRDAATSLPAVDDARTHDGPVVIDFRVEQEDTVYPMVPAGADLHAMIRRPNPIVETAADQ